MTITVEWIFMLGVSVGLGLIGYLLKTTHKDFKERFEKVEHRLDRQDKEVEVFKGKHFSDMSRQNKEFEELKVKHLKDMNQLKFNYIKRFEETNEKIQATKDIILEKLEDIRSEFAGIRSEMREQKQFCYLVQKGKEDADKSQ